MANLFGQDDEVITSPSSISFGQEDEIITPAPSQNQQVQSTNPSWLQMDVDIAGKTLNPIGAAADTLNRVPYVQDVIPDFLVDSLNTSGRGTAGGAYNAAQHTLQLGADVQDFIIPGQSTPMSDSLNTILPEYQYGSTSEAVTGNLTEVTLGLVLGNKVGALAKAERLAPAVAEKITKFVPQFAEKFTQYLWTAAQQGAQGVAGITATTAPDQTGLVTGDNAMFGKWIEGLPTDSPDAAQNALAARVNLGIDSFITGVGVSKGAEALRGLYTGFLDPQIVSRIAPVFSKNARLKALFDGMGEELKKITGGETPEGLKKIWNRLYEMASNSKAHILETDLGIEGVSPISTNLDLATSIGRQAETEMDQQIKTMLDAQAKKVGQKGYEQTAIRRGGPARDIGRALEQTQEVLGGPAVAQQGARDLQRLGDAEVKAGQTQQMLEQGAITGPEGSGTKIVENVNRARELRTKQVNDLYDAIPDDVKYEGASINKIIANDPEALPDEIIKLLGKDSDGSFKFLNNKVRPRVSAMIKQLDKAEKLTREDRRELTALKALRDNIDKDQIKYLQDVGREDVVTATKTAKEAYEERVAQNRQGVVGDIQDIEAKEGLSRDEILSQGRDKLEKVVGNWKYPEHRKRLYDVLAADEGGRSDELIEKYVKSKDKIKELENISDEVYGNKLREFFDTRSQQPLPEGAASFKQLLDDPQSTDRIKYMVDLAEKSGDKSVNKALQYTYSRSLHEKLNTGFLTELGEEQTSASGIRKVLSNDSFLNAGKEIFKDNPQFMETAIDMITLANNIQRSSYLKAAPATGWDRLNEGAKQALSKILNPIYGPLSHTSLQIRTFWGAILESLGAQGAYNASMDMLLADGDLFARAYKEMMSPKKNNKLFEKSTKVLINTMIRKDADREKFNKAAERIRAEQQTEEILNEPLDEPEEDDALKVRKVYRQK